MKVEMSEILRAHPFTAGMDEEMLALIGGCASNVVFAPGELLCAEGASADTFYLVRRGHVSIEVHAPGRGAIVIETVARGDVVGWSWLVPPYHWTFDARAQEPVGCIAVDGACLRAKASSDPALGFALLSRVSVTLLERLQATRLRLLDLYGSGRGR
ncbi:MAG: cyclic nucleotide-binding domain-containing protein [Acidimicrobiales bacterium]